MRNILLLLLLLVTTLTGWSQSPAAPCNPACKLDSFITMFNQMEAAYDCNDGMYVSSKSFFKLTNQAFAKVIVKGDDIVKNGTASNLSIDKDKSTLSGNANFRLRDNIYGNISLAGNTKGKALVFFQEGGYNKGFTITPGFDIKIRSSIFYNPDSCAILRAKRFVYLKKLVYKLQTYVATNAASLQGQIDLHNQFSTRQITQMPGVTSEDDIYDIPKNLKRLTDSLEFYHRYFDVNNSVADTVEVDYQDFETKNAPLNGYTLHWLNISPFFSNQGYNIFDTSLTSRIVNDTLKKDYFRTYGFTLSYNYVRNSPRLLLYLYGGISGQNQFGLTDFTVKSGELIGGASAIVEKNSIEALDITDISATYHKSYLAFVPQLGGFAFFGKNKIIGIEGYASLNVKSKTPDLIEYRPSWNFRFGPLFSMAKADGVISTGTLGLILAADNLVVNKTKLANVLTFSVRLGIPFSNISGL